MVMTNKIEIGNTVIMKNTLEVEPLVFINQGTVGIVIDKTYEDWVCIRYDRGYFWVHSSHLKVFK